MVQNIPLECQSSGMKLMPSLETASRLDIKAKVRVVSVLQNYGSSVVNGMPLQENHAWFLCLHTNFRI